jgi:transcriptional regulator with XRE-family HTH domain
VTAEVVTTVGVRVRALRQRAGLSQRGLASLAAVDKTTVQALEMGRAPGMNLHTLSTLARALRVPIGVLVGEQPGPHVDGVYWRQVRREVEQQWEVA